MTNSKQWEEIQAERMEVRDHRRERGRIAECAAHAHYEYESMNQVDSFNDLEIIHKIKYKNLLFMQEYTFNTSGPAFGVKSHFKPNNFLWNDCSNSLFMAINAGSQMTSEISF